MHSAGLCRNCNAANHPTAKFCAACGKPLQSSPELLKQRYHILTTVGQGGFGAIYQAEDTSFPNRPKRAVKEMLIQSQDPHEQQQAVAAFKQEAILLAGLMHQNLPRIYEYFEEQGRWYLVMDYIDGQTLEDYVQTSPGGKLPLQQVFHVALQLCTVLDYLHTQQPPIIFRDLKPENVIMTTDDHLYLIDFGIARLFKPGQARDTLALGSPGYAAPEQYGKAQTTARADMYSLGATLHYLLSGRDPSEKPFQFPPLDLAHSAPAGPALAALIMQMVEIDEEKRPASVRSIKQELQRLSQQPVTGTPQQTTASTATNMKQTTTSNTAGTKQATASGSTAPSSASQPPGQESQTRPPTGTLLYIYRKHLHNISAVAWSPDSRAVASGSLDGLHIWHATTGSQKPVYSRHAAHVLAWSPDGTRIAYGYKSICVHNVSTGREMFTYRKYPASIYSTTWSPDGTRIASGGISLVVHVWEATTGRVLSTYLDHPDSVHALAWSPDSRYVASGSNDRTVQIWDAATGGNVSTYRRHSSFVKAVAWSPDGKRIASGDRNGMIRIWDATTGDTIATYPGHSNSVEALAWSPDDKYIASGGWDHTVQIWDTTNARTIFIYRGHSSDVQAVAWSPDGKHIASGGKDNTVQVWVAP